MEGVVVIKVIKMAKTVNQPWQVPRQWLLNKFKGNCADLDGHIFDCLDYKQANTYVHMHKWIAEYVGANYKSRGDVHAFIIAGMKITNALLTHPTFSKNYCWE